MEGGLEKDVIIKCSSNKNTQCPWTSSPTPPPIGISKGMVHSYPKSETTSRMPHVFIVGIVVEFVFEVNEEEEGGRN